MTLTLPSTPHQGAVHLMECAPFSGRWPKNLMRRRTASVCTTGSTATSRPATAPGSAAGAPPAAVSSARTCRRIQSDGPGRGTRTLSRTPHGAPACYRRAARCQWPRVYLRKDRHNKQADFACASQPSEVSGSATSELPAKSSSALT